MVDAQADVRYLESREQGVKVGVIFGNVFRRCVDRDRRPQLCAPEDSLEVVAVGAGQRISVTTDRFGPFQIVLPPGAFEIWLERNGKRLSTKIWVEESAGNGRRLPTPGLLQVAADEERRVLLSAEVS